MLPRGSLYHAHCDKMSIELEETPHIQASFSTKNVKYAAYYGSYMSKLLHIFYYLISRYSIPKTSFSIAVTASRDDLSSLINQLLQDQGTEAI